MQKTMTFQATFQLTIVIPLYNEVEMVPELCRELIQIRAKLPSATQIIFVDDGSSDGTVKELRSHSIRKVYSVTILSLSRNFGHQAALLAGMEASRGKVTVTMDGDLQHPVVTIPLMLAQHKQGIDIVHTSRVEIRSNRTAKRVSASIFYRLFSLLSQTNIEPSCSDFRSMNRKSLDALLSMDEKSKFLRGMVQWIGFTSITLPYQVGLRAKGTTKYSWKKMLHLSVAGITSFSTLPLYLSVIFCALSMLGSLIYIVHVVYVSFILNIAVSGWASTILVLLLVSSSLFLVLSIYGFYFAAIYQEVKKRPNYVIDNTY